MHETWINQCLCTEELTFYLFRWGRYRDFKYGCTVTNRRAGELTMKVRFLWGFGMYIMCDYDKLPIRYIVRMCVPSLMLYDPGADFLNMGMLGGWSLQERCGKPIKTSYIKNI